MPANNIPIFVKTPVTKGVAITNSACTRAGAGAVPLITGGEFGTRVESITITVLDALSVSSAVLLFLETGGVKYLINDIELSLFAPAGSASERPQYDLMAGSWLDASDRRLLLPKDAVLYVGTIPAAAATIQLVALGGDF